jgi:hypothetical protein
MGTMVAVFCENKQRFFRCSKVPLPPDQLRRTLGSRYRYCVGANYFYIPLEQDGLEPGDRLCWVRDREYYSIEALDRAYATGEIGDAEVYVGNSYLKRRKEEDGKFVEVESFISKELFEGLQQNPEVLATLAKDDFESLCAELFVKRGFEVDLFRRSKGGGIDFLAVNGDEIDPAIFAVQCKQPDVREGKSRKSLGRPTVQQIYGAAKAWDLTGAVAISGSTYSAEAEAFARNKPSEIEVYDADDVLKWLRSYRWNEDE